MTVNILKRQLQSVLKKENAINIPEFDDARFPSITDCNQL